MSEDDDDLFAKLIHSVDDEELSFIDDYDDVGGYYNISERMLPPVDPFFAAGTFPNAEPLGHDQAHSFFQSNPPQLPSPSFRMDFGAPSWSPASSAPVPPSEPDPAPAQPADKPPTDSKPKDPAPATRERSKSHSKPRAPSTQTSPASFAYEDPDLTMPDIPKLDIATYTPGLGKKQVSRLRRRRHDRDDTPAKGKESNVEANDRPTPPAVATSIPIAELSLEFPLCLGAFRRLLEVLFVGAGAGLLIGSQILSTLMDVHRSALRGLIVHWVHVTSLLALALGLPVLVRLDEALLPLVLLYISVFTLCPTAAPLTGRTVLTNIRHRWLYLTVTLAVIGVLRTPLITWLGLVAEFNAPLRMCTAYMVLIFHTGLTFCMPVVIHWLIVSVLSILGGGSTLVLYVVALTIVISSTSAAFCAAEGSIVGPALPKGAKLDPGKPGVALAMSGDLTKKAEVEATVHVTKRKRPPSLKPRRGRRGR
ncbi:putative dihydrolipoamide acyltransferase [Carpediemonas membranifera]|uniref:Putative dihydrolipoamide acyltransferase n=1 Tax=Carpediemonas membranifera TaxID=201153 RepID=A0A8J6BEM2_9EUKA|nr:putative dihydrolipoamide acyltransferase [Carpediemonas membranifera]|eukprot:KAG9395847.1 putative dihydrolipoamide acyltransferase [Carpediemonas membranifera]